MISALRQTFPIPLDYSPCDEIPERCSFPTGFVDFGLYKTRNMVMSVGQSYRLQIVLDLPESEINFKVWTAMPPQRNTGIPLYMD